MSPEYDDARLLEALNEASLGPEGLGQAGRCQAQADGLSSGGQKAEASVEAEGWEDAPRR